jgi:hypothetical protein
MRFFEDDKLPVDLARKEYSTSRYALCCLECGIESEFNPQEQGAIGKPLYVIALYACPGNRD